MMKQYSFIVIRVSLFIGLTVFLSACGGSSGGPPQSQETDVAIDMLAEVNRAYSTDSPYREALGACFESMGLDFRCSFADTPLLGLESEEITIAQIMARVGVSHPWMGARFEEVLRDLPPDTLALFKPLKAIMIGSSIRPASYSASDGLMFFDPAYLWLSVDEKLTIDPADDYRVVFSEPLAFRAVHRYVIDGGPAYTLPSLTSDETREYEDMVLIAIRVLFHELGHANDFLSPENFPENTGEPYVWQFSFDDLISNDLQNIYPLENDVLRDIAQVMYVGRSPSDEQIALTAEEIGNEFSSSGALFSYSFTHMVEDLAMLFEASLMKYYFGADYEVAFTSVPENPDLCNGGLVGWGQRYRLGDENVSVRAKYITERAMPHVDFGDFFETLAEPEAISGDWCFAVEDTESQKLSILPVHHHDFVIPYH